MTTEAAPRIDEQPATYRRKLQLWLGIAFGIVLALLFVLTLINIFSKMGGKAQPKTETAKVEQASQTGDREDQFNQLVANRRPNRAAQDAGNGEGQSPLEESFNKLVQGGKEASSGVSATEGQQGREPTQSAAEKAMRQWEQREKLRALQSAQSGWGLAKSNLGKRANASTSVATAPAMDSPSSAALAGGNRDLMGSLDTLNRPLDETTSIEERRAEVRRRIEEAQRLRAELATKGTAGLPNASGLTAPDQEQAKQQLQQVSSSFNRAPQDVVGYSKSNKYNADIAGKIKVPPGTLIPTTLMRKSISDYMTGSLQSIVSHDVYDTTRQYVLFPKGTEINIGVARTRNVNEAISNRVAFLVKEGVLPNGNRIDFTKASTVDREGVGAIEDQVDYHFMAQFLGVAAYAIVSSESSYSGSGDKEGSYAGDVGENTRREFSPLVQKYLNIVPTVTIRPGQSFRVIVEEEMYVEPWSDLYAKYVD
ncbi:TrbI/VirB10 family protein [Pseudomonas sp. RIT-PI-AD]|uniref:TrbI/VirB10 family protein n=1 Tax=Pseudomonas sp. RIT-PI-AD TaxID=3035294 RepID=UPI0021D8DAA9|nr:TrbI/VirB10 family protein [Pseudomonas sp. RIT-PI-AD]